MVGISSFLEAENIFDGYYIEPEEDNVYGDVNEEPEFNIHGNNNKDPDCNVVQNPYYGGEIEMEIMQPGKTRKNVDLNNTEIVTTTKNIYYEM